MSRRDPFVTPLMNYGVRPGLNLWTPGPVQCGISPADPWTPAALRCWWQTTLILRGPFSWIGVNYATPTGSRQLEYCE